MRGSALERQLIQNEVDRLLQSVQLKYRIVKKQRAAQFTGAIVNKGRAKLLNGWRSLGGQTNLLYQFSG